MIDGKSHHFAARGLYNGLSVLGDRESGSYWDHITGTCLHGPLKGYQLEVYPLLHTTVAGALARHPEIRVAVSKQTLVQRSMAYVMERGRRSKRGVLPPGFKRTMGVEDTRRRRMDLGLGVWSGRTHRYYPLERLRAHGGALIDELEGRRLLVCVDPGSGAPGAFYTEASRCAWEGAALRLDTGEVVRDAALYDGCGTLRPAVRPMQVFARWYGFAYTFPGCEVYGG